MWRCCACGNRETKHQGLTQFETKSCVVARVLIGEKERHWSKCTFACSVFLCELAPTVTVGKHFALPIKKGQEQREQDEQNREEKVWYMYM